MKRPDQVDTAMEERARARFLHQNYLARRDDEPSKAAEHLWGAVNNLLSARHRLEAGSGLSRHRDVVQYLDEVVAATPGLSSDHRDAVEDLHGHYYHHDLAPARLRRELERATTLYDHLTRHLSDALDE